MSFWCCVLPISTFWLFAPRLSVMQMLVEDVQSEGPEQFVHTAMRTCICIIKRTFGAVGSRLSPPPATGERILQNLSK